MMDNSINEKIIHFVGRKFFKKRVICETDISYLNYLSLVAAIWRKECNRVGTNYVMVSISFYKLSPLRRNRTTQLLQRDMHGGQLEAFVLS